MAMQTWRLQLFLTRGFFLSRKLNILVSVHVSKQMACSVGMRIHGQKQ